MKLLRIVISFTLVNILVSELVYKDEVYLTNKYIQLAVSCNQDVMYRSGHLMTVVKNIVLKQYTIVEMALMLVVPETQEVLVIKHGTQEHASTSSVASNEIVEIETNEALVIKHEKLWYQQRVRYEINAVTGMRRAFVDKVELDRCTMEYLGSERRYFTGAAVIQLIHAIIITKNPVLRSAFSDFPQMCRLLGLYRSFKNVFEKLPFIKSAKVHDGTCVLKTLDNSETKYRYINEDIWELKANGTGLQRLYHQIEFFNMF
ncbi:uncharacterized protein LOC126835969 [Adelges cooleyi]|uniref:uncharacterized protein LOC126835969 n=1 Tax=Adelges cooleyi TaxID=133065 RepID=UPI00217F978D|nr:uncharacterized protein LOC126835969 [Adelges cooleyi]